jgi:hypothetical protein
MLNSVFLFTVKAAFVDLDTKLAIFETGLK